MGNKKATDLGISTFMNEVKNNKSAGGEKREEDFGQSLDLDVDREEKKVEKEEVVIRNVILSPESLFRLESVKKKMNEGRKKGEKPISMARLMADIITDFLDEKYPQTKELYRLMKTMNG
ncbi:hypothetical protein [Bacteroides zoogleoformans]|uniref:hypothetical protein n=1 Tax=Bacteroides zoogleoformans TaxID=28119 RepID=UPI00248E7C3D|nr:hypothetical protein [Bacteroides zoogleoformans]